MCPSMHTTFLFTICLSQRNPSLCFIPINFQTKWTILEPFMSFCDKLWKLQIKVKRLKKNCWKCIVTPTHSQWKQCFLATFNHHWVTDPGETKMVSDFPWDSTIKNSGSESQTQSFRQAINYLSKELLNPPLTDWLNALRD